jgi:hypothetical protein
MNTRLTGIGIAGTSALVMVGALYLAAWIVGLRVPVSLAIAVGSVTGVIMYVEVKRSLG